MDIDIEKLINKIIPPNDYHHRNGFNNSNIIDELNDHDKKLIEDILISKLLEQTNDTLVVETLAYLKSEKALPLLYDFLKRCSDAMAKIITAASIFEINNDDITMIDVAIDSFKKLDNNNDSYYIYRLIPAFYYLVKFKNSKVNNLIKEYTTHREYLISYNAKQALNE